MINFNTNAILLLIKINKFAIPSITTDLFLIYALFTHAGLTTRYWTENL